jgi:5'(3')-deoxyribonucleotidase
MHKKILYIDMDDTLCDFTASYKEKKTSKICHPQSQYGFKNLKPIEGAIDAYNELDLIYDVWILSRPSVHNPLCYTEKRVWVEEHLGFERCRKLILSPNKALLKGDFLIDDYDHPGFEGELIKFGSKKYPDWYVVLDYLKQSK